MTDKYNDWLVVSDIDGTLNNKFRTLPKKNYDAIKAFTENGGHFTLASGRMVSSLERNYNRVCTNAPAVVINGAGIYDYNKKEMIWRRTIDDHGLKIVEDVLNKFKHGINRVDVGVFYDDNVSLLRTGVLSKGQLFFDKSNYDVTTYDKVNKDGWMKVIFWSNPITINRLKKYLDVDNRDDVTFMSSSIWSLEMLAKGTNKGSAVMELAKMLGIEKTHVAAIGDYYNDYEMLKAVGLPACAGQAPKPLHDIAKFEACHCNKGCVADLIKYIMFHNGGIKE